MKFASTEIINLCIFIAGLENIQVLLKNLQPSKIQIFRHNRLFNDKFPYLEVKSNPNATVKYVTHH
jgi:hypothetical protein